MSNAEPSVAAHGRSLALWAGVIGAPAVWVIQLQIGYSLSPLLCKQGHHYVFHVVTVVCLVLTIIGIVLSWRDWKAAGEGSPDESDGGAEARTRFLGALGMLTAILSTLVILAQGIASFFFDPCWF